MYAQGILASMYVPQKAVFANNHLERLGGRAGAIADNSFLDKDLQSHCHDDDTLRY
ncbi:hypothetical protein BJG93_35560 [Paraburkholderia sprentiae WSM5005]|uniref:Uncharacterized protein n=1 Tax=Paraburkholderia sprentiae WSM5005 TaxID=754502 RepID=A0A8F4KIA5_9BURK|nr:hypothetical protein [Paraburkholderia sprentiae]QXE07282.1 hypothetical protein BJG93_35560 [Paraburkholderia sprentiae WSM5005]